jgi:hypothetical protein
MVRTPKGVKSEKSMVVPQSPKPNKHSMSARRHTRAPCLKYDMNNTHENERKQSVLVRLREGAVDDENSLARKVLGRVICQVFRRGGGDVNVKQVIIGKERIGRAGRVDVKEGGGQGNGIGGCGGWKRRD